MKAYEISMPLATAPQFISATAPSASVQAVDARTPSTKGSTHQDQNSTPVDSVTLLNKLQDTKREARKEEANRSERKQERTMQSIQFDYNNKGDLRIRFTDSKNKLVYQTPPVYFTMMSDLMARPELSVNTKV